MREFLSASAVLWCAMTYWLGGQSLPIIHRSALGNLTVGWRGFKWIRRYVMASGLVIFLVLLSVPVWKACLACLALSAATHVGYQDKLWKFLFVGLLLGVGSVVIGVSWTCLLPCAFHGVLGAVSLRDNKFGWSWVAILTGASVGIAYVYPIR